MFQVARPNPTNGIFKIYDNVIIKKTRYSERIQQLNVEDSSRVIILNNLTGNLLDNIIDASGYLMPNYSQYIGKNGHQFAKRPVAPKDLTIVQ